MNAHDQSMRPAVTISTYSGVRAVLVDREMAQFSDPSFESGNILENVVMQLHGEAHRQRRAVENRLFRRELVENYLRVDFPDIVDNHLIPLISTGERDVVRLSQMVFLLLSARICGIPLSGHEVDRLRHLAKLSRVFAEGTGILQTTYDPAELKSNVQDALQDFRTNYLPSAQQVDRSANDESRSDIEHTPSLLPLLTMESDKLQLDDDTIVRELAFVLESGLDTSAKTLAQTLVDIHEWRLAHSSDWNDLCNGSYSPGIDIVQSFVLESLRLNPNVQVARRVALDDLVIDGFEIAKGSLVLADIIQANRDESVYGRSAGRFDPFRDVPDKLPRYGHSFSGGAHSCPGRVVAIGLPERPKDELYGQVPQLLNRLLELGASVDSSVPLIQDVSSRWNRIGQVPILFNSDCDLAA